VLVQVLVKEQRQC